MSKCAKVADHLQVRRMDALVSLLQSFQSSSAPAQNLKASQEQQRRRERPASVAAGAGRLQTPVKAPASARCTWRRPHARASSACTLLSPERNSFRSQMPAALL